MLGLEVSPHTGWMGHRTFQLVADASVSQNSPRLLIRYSVVCSIVSVREPATRGKHVEYTLHMEKLRSVNRSRESTEQRTQWKVIEAFSEARDEVRGSEDAYLITDHCVAVFDGVSTPGNPKGPDGRTPGQRAVEIAVASLKHASDIMAEDAVALMSEHLRTAILEERLQGSPSFVFAAFFPKQNRIVRVGDAMYLVDGEGNNPGMNADRAKAIIRKRVIGRRLRDGESEDAIFTNDPSRERLRDLRDWQSHFANNPNASDFGYGVVNGSRVPEKFIEYVSVPAHTQSVVLATDGYPASVLRESLSDTERLLVDLQLRDRLGIGEEPSVRALKPENGHGATDDRTYIKIVP